MGKKGKKFLSAIKKIFSPHSKKKKSELQISAPVASYAPSQPVHPFSPSGEIKSLEAEQEQSTHAYSVAVAATQTAAEAVNLKNYANFAGNSREAAAIKIQTAFRGHLARRALRALKGLVRLKSLVLGKSVKRQAATTLRCMQTLARIQAQIRSRRIGMLEENQTLLRQHLRKREQELESLRMSEQWDESTQSKEQIEASFLHKQEALMRRERALAYAFNHQWKTPSRSSNPTFIDANNPQWGWSWLERWTRNPKTEQTSIKSKNGEKIDKSHSSPRYNRTPQRSIRPPSRNSPLTPIRTTKIKSASPREGWNRSDDDARSLISLQSERRRRYSVAGSSIRDDESLRSSATLPSYMAQTESAKAKNRFHGSIGDLKMEIVADSKDSANLVRKRLSFPLSPASVGRKSRGDGSATGKNVEGR